MEVLFATGIRRSECAYLDIGDITIDPQTLRGIERVNRGKGKKERLVPIISRAGECVILYLQEVTMRLKLIKLEMYVYWRTIRISFSHGF